ATCAITDVRASQQASGCCPFGVATSTTQKRQTAAVNANELRTGSPRADDILDVGVRTHTRDASRPPAAGPWGRSKQGSCRRAQPRADRGRQKLGGFRRFRTGARFLGAESPPCHRRCVPLFGGGNWSAKTSHSRTLRAPLVSYPSFSVESPSDTTGSSSSSSGP